ncbi:angiopoietin-related protein 7-like [Drosophila sulfurigaster albostrigata]|uniref:angiopoietin-related protein 7-like n=1 Tax=Drosophila sulfurigaster albostrigata TaxID=89887 RepID=UPI002D219B80|nr:angiopoietin-related protein 7-like [Drosophila sulfurigaster albostrigata]
MLDYLRHVRKELDRNELMNREIQELRANRDYNNGIIKELRNQIEFQKEIIRKFIDISKRTDSCDDLSLKVSDRTKMLLKCEHDFKELNKTFVEKSDSLVKLENKFNVHNKTFIANNDRLLKCENNFSELKNTFIEKNDSLVKLKNNFNELNEKYLEKNKGIFKCENKFNELNKTFIRTNESLVNWENKFNELNKSYVEQNNELLKQRKDLQMCKTDNEMLKTNEKRISDSYTSSIRSINVPDYDSFDVLFDNKTAEKDWIVIQQRIDGKEDFYRDWNTYVSGFGSFEGDFFLGLEKIHRLTYSTRYQLLIRVEYFNGTIRYAGYDNFKVDGNETDYTLRSLGKFSGDNDGQPWEGDNLRHQEGMKFSTFDRDNDRWDYDCAKYHKAGWWHNYCTVSNLNGLYSVEYGTKYTLMSWSNFTPLKSVQMMIRKYQPL